MTDEMWQPHEVKKSDVPGTLLEFLADQACVDAMLVEHKALVFRGFEVHPDELEGVLDLTLPHRLAYVHGNSPRTKVGANVYTSTEYPAEFTISMHNELSYSARWPARLMFYCRTAPTGGGATPVVDGARWLASLSAEVQDAFRGRGLRYVQNLHDGLGFGRSWQDTFETEDAAAVEAVLTESGCTWQWLADGTLRIQQVRSGTLCHPVTGQEVWFNQADQWHPSTLDTETATALLEIYAGDELPQSVTFADGGAIPPEYVAEIRDRGLEHAVDVDWHEGDLLLIDNVAVAHGRRPFTGPRRILVAMSG